MCTHNRPKCINFICILFISSELALQIHHLISADFSYKSKTQFLLPPSPSQILPQKSKILQTCAHLDLSQTVFDVSGDALWGNLGPHLHSSLLVSVLQCIHHALDADHVGLLPALWRHTHATECCLRWCSSPSHHSLGNDAMVWTLLLLSCSHASV